MRYNRIKLNDVANGPGIGISLYTQGCPHHCKGCFNKETWSFDGGKPFTQEEEKLIIDSLNGNGIKRHLSILGGEPFCPQNIDGVLNFCEWVKIKSPETKIYVWTGYNVETIMKDYSLEDIDFVIDGKFEESLKDLSLKWRGSSNQRVIDVKKSLEQEKLVIIIP